MPRRPKQTMTPRWIPSSFHYSCLLSFAASRSTAHEIKPLMPDHHFQQNAAANSNAYLGLILLAATPATPSPNAQVTFQCQETL